MNNERKKQLKQEYALSRSRMGILCVRHTASGDCFLLGAKNADAVLNSCLFQAKMGSHPDKELQALFIRYGESAFEITICRELPYDKKDPEKTDYSEELMELFHKTLVEIPGSRIINIPGRNGVK